MNTVNNDPRIACPNANWNGVTTNYCDGVTSDDVVAHEWGHAYTEYTHGLIYQWQSGALNESYSDIWGETARPDQRREDEGEGDINAKRPVGLCSTHSPAVPLRDDQLPRRRSRRTASRAAPRSARSWTPPASPVTSSRRRLDAADAAGPARPPTAARRSPTRPTWPARSCWSTAARAPSQARPQNATETPAPSRIIVGNNADELRRRHVRRRPDVVATVGRSASTRPRAIRTGDHGRRPVNVTMRDAGGAARRLLPLADRREVRRRSVARSATCGCPPATATRARSATSSTSARTDDSGGVHSNSGVPEPRLRPARRRRHLQRGHRRRHRAHQGRAHLLQGDDRVPDAGQRLRRPRRRARRLVRRPDRQADQQRSASKPNDSRRRTTRRSRRPTARRSLRWRRPSSCARSRSSATSSRMLDPNTPALCGAGHRVRDRLRGGLRGGPRRLGPGRRERVRRRRRCDWETSTDLPEGNAPAGSETAAFGPAPDEGACTGDAADFSSVNTMTSPEIERRRRRRLQPAAVVRPQHPDRAGLRRRQRAGQRERWRLRAGPGRGLHLQRADRAGHRGGGQHQPARRRSPASPAPTAARSCPTGAPPRSTWRPWASRPATRSSCGSPSAATVAAASTAGGSTTCRSWSARTPRNLDHHGDPRARAVDVRRRPPTSR